MMVDLLSIFGRQETDTAVFQDTCKIEEATIRVVALLMQRFKDKFRQYTAFGHTASELNVHSFLQYEKDKSSSVMENAFVDAVIRYIEQNPLPAET